MGSAYVRSDVTYQWISSMIASVVQWSSGGATSGWVAAGTVDIVSAPMKLLQVRLMTMIPVLLLAMPSLALGLGVRQPPTSLPRRAALARGLGVGCAVLAVPPARAVEFTKTDTGLLFYDKKLSDGVTPKSGQTVQVDYEGWLDNFDVDFSKFDSSYARGKPISFAVGTGRVIKAWDEALLTAGGGMRVGATRRIIVPPDLGYGLRGSGSGKIPPGATLYFEMTLVGVK